LRYINGVSELQRVGCVKIGVNLQGEAKMLALTRQQGQKIQIGRDITVTVVRTQGGQVRLGIEAPASVVITRAELADHSSTYRNATIEAVATPRPPGDSERT
jgi:carbon storage regulator